MSNLRGLDTGDWKGLVPPVTEGKDGSSEGKDLMALVTANSG